MRLYILCMIVLVCIFAVRIVLSDSGRGCGRRQGQRLYLRRKINSDCGRGYGRGQGQGLYLRREVHSVWYYIHGGSSNWVMNLSSTAVYVTCQGVCHVSRCMSRVKISFLYIYIRLLCWFIYSNDPPPPYPSPRPPPPCSIGENKLSYEHMMAFVSV